MAQKIITDIIQAEIQVGKKIKLNQDNLKKYSEFNSEQAFEQLKRSSNNTTLESSISGIFSKGVIDIERLVQLYKLQDENITPIELQSIISRYSSTSGEIVGLDYDGFQKLVGQNITDTKRKNPIFENSNLQNSKAGQPLSERSMVALQSIFLLELDLLRFTEKQKVILKNTFNYEPMNFFNSINFNNSAALNFEQLQQFFRSNGQEISKEDYQVLISRIKRSKQLSSNDYDQFISQQEFIQLTVPHLPYSNKLSAAALNVSKASVQGQQQQQQQQQVNSLKQNDKSVKFQLEGENNVDISNVILSPAAVNVNFQQQQQSKQAADLQQVENFQLNSNISNNVMYGDSISVQNQNIQLMQQQQLLQQQKEQQQQQQLYLQQQKEQQQQQQLQQQQQQLQLQQLQQQQQQQQQQYKQQQQQKQPQQIQQQPQQQQYQQQQQQQHKQQQPQQYNQQQPQSQSAQIAPQTLGYNIGQVQQQKPQPIYAVPEYVYIKQDQQPFQQIPQQSYNIIPNVVQENVEINTVNQNNNNRANLALQAMNDLLQKDNDRLKQENLDLQQKLIEKEQLEQRARDKEELRALIMLENKQLLEQQQQQQQLQKQQLQQQQPQVELVQKQQPQQVFVAVPQLQQQLPVIQSNTALVNKYLQFQPQPQQLNSVRLSEVRPPVNAVSFPQQLQQQPLQLLQPSVINQDNFINSQPPVSSGVIHQFPGSALSSLPSAIKKPVGPASPSSPLVNTSMFSPQNTHSQQIANELVHSSYASPNVPLPGYILEPNQVPSFLVGAQQFNNRAGLANQFSPYTQAHHYNATQTELREAIHNQLPAPQQQFVQQQQQQAQYPFIPREYAQPNSGFQYPLQYP